MLDFQTADLQYVALEPLNSCYGKFLMQAWNNRQGQSSPILIHCEGSQPVIHDPRHCAHFFFF